jgi:hypothetical protein
MLMQRTTTKRDACKNAEVLDEGTALAVPMRIMKATMKRITQMIEKR